MLLLFWGKILMEDIVKIKDDIEIAKAIGTFIDEHKGENTIVLDISAYSSWTKYFIITTSTSLGHLKGLVRQLKIFLSDHNIDVYHRHKNISENGWELVDCGDYVIHLMDKNIRSFYNLEKLWFNGDILYQSSKSS